MLKRNPILMNYYKDNEARELKTCRQLYSNEFEGERPLAINVWNPL